MNFEVQECCRTIFPRCQFTLGVRGHLFKGLGLLEGVVAPRDGERVSASVRAAGRLPPCLRRLAFATVGESFAPQKGAGVASSVKTHCELQLGGRHGDARGT